MAKLTDIWIQVSKDDQRIDFETAVNVTKEGIFTTTLPKDAVEKISEYGLELSRNRLGNPGYFEAKTLEELKKNIREKCLDALSRELVEDKLVIKYEILTECAYCKDTDGELVPDGYWLKERDGSGLTDKWVDGNSNRPNSCHTPGIRVWAKVYHKRRYRYQSGKELTVLKPYAAKRGRSDSSLDWINSLVGTCPSKGTSSMGFALSEKEYNRALQLLPEVDATEKNAQFFVTMHKMIFKMNELFAGFANPEFLTKYLEMNNVKELAL